MENTEYFTGTDRWTHYDPLPGRDEWHRYLGPCPDCGSRTFDYGGGWRCMAMYCFRNSSNPAPNVGPEPNWWNTGIQVMKNGNQWCAHGPDFVNLQESPSGWGDTPNEAALDYQKKQTKP